MITDFEKFNKEVEEMPDLVPKEKVLEMLSSCAYHSSGLIMQVVCDAFVKTIKEK